MPTTAQRPYTLTKRPLVLDGSERTYTLTINDLPNEERPRERLLKLGPDALSTAELLAVLLSTGTTREGVLAMGHRILRE